MESCLERLKREGVVKAYFDFRTGTFADLSGNGYVATLVSVPRIAKSEIGMACYFDGVDDALSIGNIGNVKSVLATFKSPAVTEGIFELINNTVYASIAASVLAGTGFTAPVYYVQGLATTTLNVGDWNYTLISTNTDVAAASFTIGEANGDFFAGPIGTVIAFTRQIIASEASQLFGELHPRGVH